MKTKSEKPNSMKLEKLKTLKALLGANELILTGSTALAYHGLLTLDEAIDLDIILINPSVTSLEVLERLQTESPNPKKGTTVAFSLIFEGVKVDFWTPKEHEDTEYLVTTDGVKVASIRSIVRAKVSYNRSKDWIQLMQLSKKIFDNQKFNAALQTIVDHSDEYPET